MSQPPRDAGAASPRAPSLRGRQNLPTLERMLLSFGVLLVASLAIFLVTRWLGAPGRGSLLAGLWSSDPAAARDAVANAAQVVAGVLAIVITVVAIVVELAADRYSYRITQLFVRDVPSVLVMSFLVITTVECFWVSVTSGGMTGPGASAPRALFFVTIAMVSVSLLVLLPYFVYVFHFVSPIHVIDRLRAQALASVRRAREGAGRRGMRTSSIAAIEDLDDVARSAMQHHDRAISMAAIDALAVLLEEYEALQASLPERWFDCDGALMRDPDFVSMAPVALAEMQRQRTWFETKILRQFLSLFAESLVEARDIANLVALHTRRIAVAAAEDRRDVLDLCIRFFNSYLRAAVNARDVRSAYYVLDQYRQVAEQLFERGLSAEVEEIAGHLRFYGQLGRATGQGFLLEAVAYDLSLLIERAAERESPLVDPLLDVLLRVDRANGGASQTPGLQGVRRAQVQLATLFAVRGDRVRAERVMQEVARDGPELLRAVRDELLSETRSQYWEFTDRGLNFSYLPPERRARLGELFAGIDLA